MSRSVGPGKRRGEAKDGIEWAEHRNRYVLTTKAERKRGKPFTVVGRR